MGGGAARNPTETEGGKAKSVRYDWTGVGYGYQIQGNLPKTRKKAVEIIDQADLKKLKKIINEW